MTRTTITAPKPAPIPIIIVEEDGVLAGEEASRLSSASELNDSACTGREPTVFSLTASWSWARAAANEVVLLDCRRPFTMMLPEANERTAKLCSPAILASSSETAASISEARSSNAFVALSARSAVYVRSNENVTAAAAVTSGAEVAFAAVVAEASSLKELAPMALNALTRYVYVVLGIKPMSVKVVKSPASQHTTRSPRAISYRTTGSSDFAHDSMTVAEDSLPMAGRASLLGRTATDAVVTTSALLSTLVAAPDGRKYTFCRLNQYLQRRNEARNQTERRWRVTKLLNKRNEVCGW